MEKIELTPFFQINYKKFGLIVILAVAAVFYALNLNLYQVGHINDDAYYVNASRWLAGTQNVQKQLGLRSLGFPVLLAPVAALFPENNFPFKAVAAGFYLAAAALLFFLFAEILDKEKLLILTALTALNPLVVRLSGTVMSEGAFLFFTVLSLYLLEKCLQEDFSLKRIFLTGLSVFYLSFIRPEGSVFFIAVLIYLAVKRRWKTSLYLTFFFLILLCPLLLNVFKLGGSADRYFTEWSYCFFRGHALNLIFSNAVFYLKEFVSLFGLTEEIRLSAGILYFALAGGILFFCGFGFLICPSGHTAGILRVYITLYILLHIVWPARESRFLLGITPFAVLFLIYGLAAAGRRVMLAAVAVILISYIYQDVFLCGKKFDWVSHETFGYVRDKFPARAVFIAEAPSPFFLRTGRKALPLFHSASAADFFFDFLNSGADYIILFDKKSTALYKFPTIISAGIEKTRKFVMDKRRFEPVYVNSEERAVIFRAKDDFKRTFVHACSR
ncbi:MAG: glycosyltransferase family 39 protein [bacterium]